MKDYIKAWLKPRLIELLAEDSALSTPSDPEQAYLEERLQYLLDEVSDLRIAIRELTGPKQGSAPKQDQTKESFSFQWAEITEGTHLLGDPAFESTMYELLELYTGFSKDWFEGKRVLDAGCGMGRWSYAMAKIGADVTAVDQSPSGIAHVSKLLADLPNFQAHRHDLLDPLKFDPAFDLVFSYGVAHHTGNTKLATRHVADMVKPGGRLFLMIYGEPSKPGEFTEINTYVKHRRATRNMTFEQKKKYLDERYAPELVHGFFDAISPEINDLHRFDEIAGWLHGWGFVDIRRTLDSRNIHMVADRPA